MKHEKTLFYSIHITCYWRVPIWHPTGSAPLPGSVFSSALPRTGTIKPSVWYLLECTTWGILRGDPGLESALEKASEEPNSKILRNHVRYSGIKGIESVSKLVRKGAEMMLAVGIAFSLLKAEITKWTQDQHERYWAKVKECRQAKSLAGYEWTWKSEVP